MSLPPASILLGRKCRDRFYTWLNINNRYCFQLWDLILNTVKLEVHMKWVYPTVFNPLPRNLLDKRCPVEVGVWWAGPGWCGGHSAAMFTCFPLVSTCLRRLRAGSTTWLLAWFSDPKVCGTCFFTFSTPLLGLSSSRCSGDAWTDWAWWPLIMPSDVDMLQGDTSSWQPLPLMAEANLPEALSSSGSWLQTRRAWHRTRKQFATHIYRSNQTQQKRIKTKNK